MGWILSHRLVHRPGFREGSDIRRVPCSDFCHALISSDALIEYDTDGSGVLSDGIVGSGCGGGGNAGGDFGEIPLHAVSSSTSSTSVKRELGVTFFSSFEGSIFDSLHAGKGMESHGRGALALLGVVGLQGGQVCAQLGGGAALVEHAHGLPRKRGSQHHSDDAPGAGHDEAQERLHFGLSRTNARALM